MKEFFAFAEREDFQRLVNRATKYPAVQGITIDYDPLWLHMAKLRQVMPKEPFEGVLDDIFRWVRVAGLGIHLSGSFGVSPGWKATYIRDGWTLLGFQNGGSSIREFTTVRNGKARSSSGYACCLGGRARNYPR
jgi:hypothetical protein